MKYNCTAHFSYAVVVDAISAEDAEMIVFNCLADDAVIGLIRTDLFNNGSGQEIRFPWLHSVEVLNVLA